MRHYWCHIFSYKRLLLHNHLVDDGKRWLTRQKKDPRTVQTLGMALVGVVNQVRQHNIMAELWTRGRLRRIQWSNRSRASDISINDRSRRWRAANRPEMIDHTHVRRRPHSCPRCLSDAVAQDLSSTALQQLCQCTSCEEAVIPAALVLSD